MASRSLGTAPGETRFAGLPSTEAEAREVLRDATPDQVEASLRASLPLSLGSRIRTRWIYPEGTDGQANPQVGGYEIEGKVPLRDAETALRVLALLDLSDTPRLYGAELARLKVLTVSKHLTGNDLALQVAVMTDELMTYPLDVARHACRTWARGNKFFPAWAELKEICEEAVRFRRSLARALSDIIDTAEAQESAKAAPACAGWRDNDPAIRAAIGDHDWRTWLSQVTPHDDDGAVLVLAVPTRLIGDMIRDKFGATLQQALGRDIRFIVTAYAGPAARRRDREGRV